MVLQSGWNGLTEAKVADLNLRPPSLREKGEKGRGQGPQGEPPAGQAPPHRHQDERPHLRGLPPDLHLPPHRPHGLLPDQHPLRVSGGNIF